MLDQFYNTLILYVTTINKALVNYCIQKRGRGNEHCATNNITNEMYQRFNVKTDWIAIHRSSNILCFLR